MKWMKIDREIVDHPVFADPDRFRSWIWILAKVCWGEERQNFGGRQLDLAAGSMAITQGELAAQLGWSRAKVRATLAWFEREGMISVSTVEKGGKAVGIVLSVCKWAAWQSCSSRKSSSEQPDERPNEQPNQTRTRTRRSKQEQPNQQPDEQPTFVRAIPCEKKKEISVEDDVRASAPSTPDEDIRVQDCIRPAARLTNDGVIVVQFEGPPQKPTRKALKAAGFVYRAEVADRRRGQAALSWWMADDTPERRDLVLRVTGQALKAVPRRSAAQTSTLTAPKPTAPPVPRRPESTDAAALRVVLGEALGPVEADAAFGPCHIAVAEDVVVLSFLDEMTALLVQKKYGRVVERASKRSAQWVVAQAGEASP